MRRDPRCLGWMLACCLSMSSPTFAARNDVPLPPLLAGEELARPLFVGQAKMFAPAVAGPQGSVLVFQGDELQAQLRQIPLTSDARDTLTHLAGFTVPQGPRIGYSKQFPASYASVRTDKGIWLLGPTVEFVSFDGRRISGQLQWPRHQVKAVLLNDGSVAVVGGLSWPETRDFSSTVKAERVWLDEQGRIRVEALPALLDLGKGQMLTGFSLVHVGNGRILLVGRKLTLLFEPGAASWQRLDGMHYARSNPALIRLPDGRIWASGGGEDFGDLEAATTSEIWNPTTAAWVAGPDLPVPMIDHSAVLAGDTVLLAGGYFPTVLAWKIGAPSAFIAAQHAQQRRQASVILLPDKRLALVGGSYARVPSESGGRGTPGIAVVSVDTTARARHAPAFATVLDGALLERGGQVLTVGGLMQHSYRSGETKLGTRLVERGACGRNDVATLPTLSVVVGRTQAVWGSGSEALIYAEIVGGAKRGEPWLGLVDLRTGAQRALPLPENVSFNGTRLVGAQGGRGWLLSEDARALRVSVAPDQPAIENVPRMVRRRQGFVARVLEDGRVIVAGGNEEPELVAARTAGCTDCGISYIGYGMFGPSRHHEIFDPSSSRWMTSSPARTAGESAAIFPDGRVAKFGVLVPQDEAASASAGRQGMLEISDREGKEWRTLEFPQGVIADYPNVALRVLQNETAGLKNALFLGLRRDEVTEWWWVADVNAEPLPWRSLGVAVPPYSFPPGEIDSGMTTADGRKLYFLGGDTGIIGCARK